MKSFLYKTSPVQNQKLYKNFTNPMPGKVFTEKPAQFSYPDNDSNNIPSQEEIALNIEESFYSKVEWKKTESPHDSLKIQDVNVKTQDTWKTQDNQLSNSTASKQSSSFQTSISLENSKNENKVKNFSNDLQESLKKLDMIIADKKNLTKQNPQKNNGSQFKFEKSGKSNQIIDKEKEEIRVEVELNQLNLEDQNAFDNGIASSQRLNFKEKEESLKMQEIINEAHNHLFDPNFIGQIDPATYTNPLFLIGFLKIVKNFI